MFKELIMGTIMVIVIGTFILTTISQIKSCTKEVNYTNYCKYYGWQVESVNGKYVCYDPEEDKIHQIEWAR